MGYRNMIYHIDKNFKSFTRHLNFTLDEISNSQGVECLKIIKNNTKSEVKKEEIQNLIDGIFNENHEHRDKTISFIRDYFFKDLSINKATKYNLITSEEIRENNKIIKELEEFDEQYKIREIGEIKKIRNPNIRIEHYVKYNAYAFIYKYEILNDEEYVIIKNSKNLQLHYNFMSFNYRGNICTCEFDSNSLPRIKNLLKNSEYVDLTAVKNIEIPEIIEETPKQKRPMKRLTKNPSSISEKNIIHEFESNKLTEFEDYEFNDYGRAVTSVITKQF